MWQHETQTITLTTVYHTGPKPLTPPVQELDYLHYTNRLQDSVTGRSQIWFNAKRLIGLIADIVLIKANFITVTVREATTDTQSDFPVYHT
jgi:hypothetical protein